MGFNSGFKGLILFRAFKGVYKLRTQFGLYSSHTNSTNFFQHSSLLAVSPNKKKWSIEGHIIPTMQYKKATCHIQ